MRKYNKKEYSLSNGRNGYDGHNGFNIFKINDLHSQQILTI